MSLMRYFIKSAKNLSGGYIYIILVVVCFLLIIIREYTYPIPARKWNQSNLEKIEVRDQDCFSFAVFGGGNTSRIVFERLLKQVDHDPDISFAVDVGDAVLKGRKPHYHNFIKEIENNLGIPLLTVMGDNELTGDGRGLYYEVLGPFYYSFKIGKNYFIILDDVDISGPGYHQMQWLEKELHESGDYTNRIIFLHRPIYNSNEKYNNQFLPEQISSKLIDLFLDYHVSHIFASGNNGFYDGDLKGIPYTVSGDFVMLNGSTNSFFHFLKVHVEKDSINVEMKKVFYPEFDKMNPFTYRIMVYLDNIIRIHWAELTLLFIIFSSFIILIIRSRKNDSRIQKKAGIC